MWAGGKGEGTVRDDRNRAGVLVVLEYGARAPGHAFEQDAGVLEMNMESLSVFCLICGSRPQLLDGLSHQNLCRGNVTPWIDAAYGPAGLLHNVG